MTASDFRLTLSTAQTPQEVFRAINNVRDWWSGFHAEEITGNAGKLNDEFIFRAAGGAHYSRHSVIEMIPDKKVVWLTTDSKLDFLEKKDEWTGTKLIFEISEKDGRTQLVFTHEGLTPEVECYEICAPTWTRYLERIIAPGRAVETASVIK